MSNWTEFYFEGKLAWGEIKSREDWQRVQKAYEGQDVDLLSARVEPGTDDCFGFYGEYTGEKTLRDFDNENGNFITVVNNFHLADKYFEAKAGVLTDFVAYEFKLIQSGVNADIILETIRQQFIAEFKDIAIHENQLKINLIEGRQKSHVPTQPELTISIGEALVNSYNNKITFEEARTAIMQAINNQPNLDCIKKGNLEYRNRILSGEEERISTGKV